MRKIVITEFVSLDGVFEAPGADGSNYKYAGWTFPYIDTDFMAFKLQELKDSDVLLLGRITYDGFAKAWPGRKDEVGFADKFNSMPKYVVSKTLKKAHWNNSHIIKTNIVKEVKKLKEGRGGTIVVHGSGTLIRFLLEQGLVDEVTLLVYPVVLGTGKRLFENQKKTDLKLISSKPFASGVMAFQYRTRK